jgi:hypothetical protein
MQGIYTHIPETNHIPREQCVATILMHGAYIASSYVNSVLLLLLLLLLLLSYCRR